MFSTIPDTCLYLWRKKSTINHVANNLKLTTKNTVNNYCITCCSINLPVTTYSVICYKRILPLIKCHTNKIINGQGYSYAR